MGFTAKPELLLTVKDCAEPARAKIRTRLRQDTMAVVPEASIFGTLS